MTFTKPAIVVVWSGVSSRIIRTVILSRNSVPFHPVATTITNLYVVIFFDTPPVKNPLCQFRIKLFACGYQAFLKFVIKSRFKLVGI